jgi:hypothetical protein
MSSSFVVPIWLEKLVAFLRRHSPLAILLLGLVIAVGGAFFWHKGKIDFMSFGSIRVGFIRGSVLIGIGSSAIAAGIVAFLSPFYESAYSRFVSLGIEKVWPSRKDLPKREWVNMLSHANEKCTLLGIAHRGWCKDDRFRPALEDRLTRGVNVKILFLKPESESARLRTEEEGRDTKAEILKSIAKIWEIREGLKAGVKERLRLYVYDATASCGLTWIDEYMIITHYLAGKPDVTSPAIRFQPAQIGTGGLYDVYAENVEIMETQRAIELNDSNIQEYLPNLQEQNELTEPKPGPNPIETTEKRSDVQ